MRHIFYINDLEQLRITKDSSLMMALSFKSLGEEALVVLENDFCVDNLEQTTPLKAYSFQGSFEKTGFYLKNFTLENQIFWKPQNGDVFHMRLDPPVDSRYISFLWMQDFLQDRGVKVVNSPSGILLNNEKLFAYRHHKWAVDSWIGKDTQAFLRFITHLKNKKIDEIIIKPLDLYCGIGVEKFSVNDPSLSEAFLHKLQVFKTPVIVQPFIKEVYQGEYRSIYFAGEEIGTIIKVPPKGTYLSNIAQGASFSATTLPSNLKQACDSMAQELLGQGIYLIAFDLLGDYVTEVNITCPGLLVEVSHAHNKNLCEIILKKLKETAVCN